MQRIKNLVVSVMNHAVAGYIRRNRILVIAVAGSIGKTSTASAIRMVLEQKYRVLRPNTAYNTNKSVHLELFGLPFATSLAGWVWMVLRVLVRSRGKAPYEVAVIEIGTDHPGELASFGWLRPKIGVLTAIAPEHMEYFKTIEAVAKEELVIADLAQQLVCNTNTVARRFLDAKTTQRAIWYGKDTVYRLADYTVQGTAVTADLYVKKDTVKQLSLHVLGEHSLDALEAAVAVADLCGLDVQAISRGLQKVQAVRGRMQPLDGKDGVLIIDDSYNASPEAYRAALRALTQCQAPQRIALMGMMNEMGAYSEQAHRQVGAWCDPQKLDLVVTLGEDANHYLAAAAESQGCTVVRCESPYQAGKQIAKHMQAGAVVLVKGSQNGVYAEEAIKALLARPEDAVKLVRQSDYWMAKKRHQFADSSS